MKPLTFHPVAEMFPLMQGAEFDDLVEDIKKHGQRHACLKTGTQIIDGRNRYRACQKLGKKCRFDEWDGKGSLTEISCSLNFHRRHLTPSQRAATGAIAEEEFAKEAVVRRKAGKPLPENVPGGEAREMAAKACGVNSRYISQAKVVRLHDPKLFDQLAAGTVTIAKAARAVHRDRKRNALKLATPKKGECKGNYEIIAGDCLKIMETLPRRSFRLVFADPPYNIGKDYGKGTKRDQLHPSEYFAWTARWIKAAAELVSPDGCFWVLINHEWRGAIEAFLKGNGLHPRAWVTWYEAFGTNCSDNFNRTSRDLLYFVRDPASVIFNHAAVNRPSKRQSFYGDRRAVTIGKNHDDVWDIPRVADNHPERLPDFPTQLPRELLRRVVGCCTEPGDRVLDPFNGSGTTGVEAIAHGCIYTGIELSPAFAKASRDRLAREIAAWAAMEAK